jgi:hypothetical protein
MIYNYTAAKEPTQTTIFFQTKELQSLVPSDKLKALVWQLQKGTWCMIDAGHYSPTQTILRSNTFEEHVINTPQLNPWCFDFLDFPVDYEPLLIDIQNGHIVLISDGSYHPELRKETAAWILEGTSSHIQLSGRIITPGVEEDQSAYRSKLAGILAAIRVINALLAYHNINPTIMLQCDCEAGINKAFDLETIHTIRDSNHDLLQAIQHELTFSSADWAGTHIKGHQDDDTRFDQLDRPSQLNVLVDKMAKSFLTETQRLPMLSTVRSRAWSISVHTIPLATHINQTLYDLVHEKEVKAYWIKKNCITEPTFNSVHWTRLGRALDNMSLS